MNLKLTSMQRMNLVLPKTHVETFGEKTFFLAGPIQGGGDWQKNAIAMLYERAPEAYIFCPCRYGPEHEMYQSSIAQWMEQTDQGVYRPGIFPSQTTWERRYLNEAYRDGCIIFWLAEESKTEPRRSGPYARDTYGELGEWRARLACEADRLALGGRARPCVVIGAEQGFPGLKQIKINFEAMLPGFVFYSTLEETVDAAVRMAYSAT